MHYRQHKRFRMFLMFMVIIMSQVSRANPLEVFENELWENLPVISLPYRENTNFENFPSHNKQPFYLSDTDIQQLGLAPWQKETKATGITLRYKLPRLKHAPNINALVFTHEIGEHERFTNLLTYHEGNVVTIRTLAYDETAESWATSESLITQEYIVLTETSYITTPETVRKTTYEIDKSGKLSKALNSQ